MSESRAHARDVPRLGVLQFDAHADLRVAYQGFRDSHASVMHNVLEQLPGVERLVSVGVRDLCEEEFARAEASNGRIVPFYDVQIRRRLHAGQPFEQIAETIVDALPEHVYISFDIDGLAPDWCPHTGTPVPGGLRIHQVETVLESLLRQGRRVVGFDLCEVAPGPHGEWDANVGARVLLKLIGHAVASHQGPLPQSGTTKSG